MDEVTEGKGDYSLLIVRVKGYYKLLYVGSSSSSSINLCFVLMKRRSASESMVHVQLQMRQCYTFDAAVAMATSHFPLPLQTVCAL